MHGNHEKSRDLWTDDEFIARHGEAARKRERPVYLGALQRPGWSGRIRTYLVWCPRCRLTPMSGFTVTHLAGHAGRIQCGYCRDRFDHLLPRRRLLAALADPLGSPWLLAFLCLLGLLMAAYARS